MDIEDIFGGFDTPKEQLEACWRIIDSAPPAILRTSLTSAKMSWMKEIACEFVTRSPEMAKEFKEACPEEERTLQEIQEELAVTFLVTMTLGIFIALRTALQAKGIVDSRESPLPNFVQMDTNEINQILGLDLDEEV